MIGIFVIKLIDIPIITCTTWTYIKNSFSILLQRMSYICCHDLCVQSIISLQFFIHFVHLQFYSSMCLWYPDIFESNKRSSTTTTKVKIYNIKSHFVSFSSGNGFLWNKNIIHFQERQSNQMVKTMCLIPLWEYHIAMMEKNLIENWILWNIEITILKYIPTPQWFYSLHSYTLSIHSIYTQNRNVNFVLVGKVEFREILDI